MGGIHLTSFIILFDGQKIENVSSLVCACVCVHVCVCFHCEVYVYHGVMKGVVWLQCYIMCVYEYVCITCIILHNNVHVCVFANFIIVLYIRRH